MEQEQLTLYKLMILYLIEKVDFPLSNSQISEFILDKGYTNYFTVQRAFHELEEENMLRVKQIRNMSHYALSDEGSEAIEMFEYQIPNSIKEDIAQFLKEKEEGTFTRQIGYFIVKNLLTNFITKPDFIAYHYKYKDCLPLKICRRFYKIPIYGWTFRDKKAYKENEPYFEGFIFEKFVL